MHDAKKTYIDLGIRIDFFIYFSKIKDIVNLLHVYAYFTSLKVILRKLCSMICL